MRAISAGVSRLRGDRSTDEYVRETETEIHSNQAHEARDEEARADEQHDGQGDFGDEQTGAHALAGLAGRARSARIAKG